MTAFENFCRFTIGLISMGMAVLVLFFFLVVMLPFRGLRIRACNVFGKVIGPWMLFLSGSRVKIEGRENLDRGRPAIYVCNHTSVMDTFIGIWLAPMKTVAIVKKEVLSYPFFGQAYLLSGMLWIDRKKSRQAIASIRKLGQMVKSKGLSIFLFPEGTRSKDGRLQPFKKGLYHLAIQTCLPVVPVIVQGAHKSWEKKTLTVTRTPISVTVLPAMDTVGWSELASEEAMEQIHEQFKRVLPADQRPLI